MNRRCALALPETRAPKSSSERERVTTLRERKMNVSLVYPWIRCCYECDNEKVARELGS